MSLEQKFKIENSAYLSKFDELAALIEHQKSKLKSLEHQNINLKFELEKAKENALSLKEENQLQKKKSLNEEGFTIQNKILKIVNTFEDEDRGKEYWNKIVESLIAEIDDAILLLKK